VRSCSRITENHTPLWAHNDTGVSSHTIRSVHAHQRAMLKATDVSHGTTLEHGSIFPSGPTPENPPKRYSAENVQKNYVSLLFERNTSGNVDSTPLQIRNAAFIPLLERQGLEAQEIGKLWRYSNACTKQYSSQHLFRLRQAADHLCWLHGTSVQNTSPLRSIDPCAGYVGYLLTPRLLDIPSMDCVPSVGLTARTRP
jgi:hypothetical protein